MKRGSTRPKSRPAASVGGVPGADVCGGVGATGSGPARTGEPGNEDHILMALLEIAKSIDTLAGAFLRIAASIERTEKTP
jgi:hypothetical protein